MSDTPYETREGSIHETRVASFDHTVERSGQFGAIAEAVQALGGPAAVAGGVGYVAKQAKDVIVAKIQANTQVEVARIENGYRPDGGAHRADD
jgi:hypothetical protein